MIRVICDYSMDCLFCKIASREIPAETIYEDAHALAFLDIHPRAAGHSVVIPKAHRETLADLKEEELAPLFSAVQRVMELLSKALHPDGFTIGVNHGKAAGQEVAHLHVHVIPRFKNDKGGSLQSVVHAPSEEPLASICRKIVQ